MWNRLLASNQMRWLLVFGLGGLIFGLLTWLDFSAPDLAEKVGLGEFKQQAKGALSFAIGKLFEVLMPRPGPVVPAPPPPPPPPPPPDDDDDDECAAHLLAAQQELAAWERYKREMDVYIAEREKRRAFMETRHATLRLMLLAILVLAFGVCVAGWIAKEHYDYVGRSVTETRTAMVDGAVFLKNLGVISIAYAGVGILIGAALYWVRATTTRTHAWRCALIAALLLNTGVLLVSLPNMVGAIWEQKIEVLGISTVPLIGWFIAFRLLFSPMLCMAGSVSAFTILNWLKPNQAAAD